MREGFDRDREFELPHFVAEDEVDKGYSDRDGVLATDDDVDDLPEAVPELAMSHDMACIVDPEAEARQREADMRRHVLSQMSVPQLALYALRTIILGRPQSPQPKPGERIMRAYDY